MIIIGGRNVCSVEVQRAIAAHPGVLDATIVGRTRSTARASLHS
jgi:acyl-CoA synthetase (AMP-forming)/AMP-acid ligase II